MSLRAVGHPVVESLGWALLHFVWQGLALALMVAVALRLMKRASAQARYLALCAAMLAAAVCPIATWSWLVVASRERVGRTLVTTFTAPPVARSEPVAAPDSGPHEPPVANVSSPNPAIESPAESFVRADDRWRPLAGDAPPPPASIARLRRLVEPALPWLVAAWLAGVTLSSLRLLSGWRTIGRIRRLATRPASPVWQARLEEIARQLRVRRAVRLVESALVEVPTVIGWLRPMILLPASALTGLAPSQLDALLAHELAHIRRHDYLVNLIQTAIETLLFYHPAVWWISRRLREERENCCDDIAVGLSGDAVAYARALATMEELRSPPTLVLAADGGSLLQRVRRLVERETVDDRTAFRQAHRDASAGVVLAVVAAALTIATFVTLAPLPAKTSASEGAVAAAPTTTDDPPETEGLEPAIAELPNSAAIVEGRIPDDSTSASDRNAPLELTKTQRPTLVLPPSPAAGVPVDLAGDPLPKGAVQRLGTTRYRVPGWWKQIGFSARGDWLWVKSDEQITVIHRETGRRIEHSQLDLGSGHIDRLAGSDDGTRVVIAQADSPNAPNVDVEHRLHVLDASTGIRKHLLKWKEPISERHALALIRDARHLACVTSHMDDSTLRVWNLTTGALVKKTTWPDGRVKAAAFSPDGDRLAVVGYGRSWVFHWEYEPPNRGVELAAKEADVVRFSPGGKLVTSGYAANWYDVWDDATGKQIAQLTTDGKHPSADGGVAFTSDGLLFAGPVNGGDEIRLWDMKTQEVKQSFECPQPRGVAISPDGRWLAAAGDSVVRFWNMETRQPVVAPTEGHADPLFKVRFAPDGRTIVTAGADATIRRWNRADGKPLPPLRHDHRRMVDFLAVSPDGRRMASSSDSEGKLWNAATGELITEWKSPKPGTIVHRFSPDSKRLVSFSGDLEITVRDAESGKVLESRSALLKTPLKGATQEGPLSESRLDLRNSGFTEDVSRFFLATPRAIHEIDVAEGKELRTIPSSAWLDGVAVSPDGHWLATVGRTTVVERFEYQLVARSRDEFESDKPGRVVATDASIRYLNFSPDSRRLAWYSSDKPASSEFAVRVADVASGRPVAKIDAVPTGWCLEFSPDGKLLATGHYDTTALLWDLAGFAPADRQKQP